jgi:hypothetical protein
MANPTYPNSVFTGGNTDADNGLILQAPNGHLIRVTVSNDLIITLTDLDAE